MTSTTQETQAEPLPRAAYTPGEVATMLGLNKATIYRYIHEGLLPARRLGNRNFRITQADIDILLSHRTTEEQA